MKKMESYLINSEKDRNKMIQLIRKISFRKKYWLGSCLGTISDVRQNQWFLGKGTFERIVYLIVRKPKTKRAIEILHKNAISNKDVTPESTEIDWQSIVIITEYDDILIYSPCKKITKIFMAWTIERNQFWLNRFGKI